MFELPDLNLDITLKQLVYGLQEEVQKTGLQKVVVGVSGGIDSALSMVLAVKALGNANVHALLLPYRMSSEDSVSDAIELCKQWEVQYTKFDISPMADSYFDHKAFSQELPNLRKGNVLARLRMITLYDFSAKLNSLVIGTSNKTEILIGYSTLWGDMASAVNPIGDLYKTYVWHLSKFLEIPLSIIEKPPSADLWQGQTDEKELTMSYDDVDKILYAYVDLMWQENRIVDSVNDELKFKVDFLLKKVKRAQFKRKMPIILKVSNRTINREFRYPRDWGN